MSRNTPGRGESLSNLSEYKVCIVGSGFFGAVMAERISRELDQPVLIVEKRAHVGGNCHTRFDEQTGIETHEYGTHIFHTSSGRVWDYINRFSGFNEYRHRVLTIHRDHVYSMPINLYTINQFYGAALTPQEAKQLVEREIAKEAIGIPTNFEEKGISLIGRALYEAFIKGYSQKQWETDLKTLPPTIISRLPVRYHYNDRYFDDLHEGIPLEGYSGIFRKMLDHPRIRVMTGTDYFQIREQLGERCLIVYTGPVDRYYDFALGRLGWRTLEFEKTIVETGDYQGTSVMNYADAEVPYTRIHEFRHLHPERKYQNNRSIIFKEFSRSGAGSNVEPYYPINTDQDKRLFEMYSRKMKSEKRVLFGGRLATYKYYDMHQVIAAALTSYEKQARPFLKGEVPDIPQLECE
jgi:UDP-galactopyranose mutase